MCGIGGILFSKVSEDVLFQRIKKLAQAQSHRGPDDQQTLLRKNHGFCHQRLSLIDKEGGKQPFYDQSRRYLIVYNGEIYNYEILRSELKNSYQFSSNSDTEVVLAAYLIWGESCLDKFIGMFSFLIWDTLSETGFAARDPLGVKPFVFYASNTEFVFASEIKAIVACLDHRLRINKNSLAEYVVAPMLSGVEDAILEGISFLGAGEKLLINKEGIKRSSYSNFSIVPGSNSLEENIRLLKFELEESTRLSLKADFPVGSFFSGGLDSSILTALAVKHQPLGNKAFTVRFQNHEQINFDINSIVNSDDFPYAKAYAESLAIPMEAVVLDTESILTALNTLGRINDRIPAWEQELSQHFLSSIASNEFKAVLVGDAADETNYGYFFLLNEQVNYGPLGLLNLFGGEKRSSLLSNDIQKSIKPLEFLNEKYTKLVSKNGFTFNGSQKDRILAMSCLVYKRWLGRLLHNGDVHTMNFGLEARVPFANQNVLKIVAGIDPDMGFYQSNEKNVLKNAARGIIPDYIINRKKSALPRDPRMGPFYQEILKNKLADQRDFVEEYLNYEGLLALSSQKRIEETDRMILFNMISLLNWGQHYAN